MNLVEHMARVNQVLVNAKPDVVQELATLWVTRLYTVVLPKILDECGRAPSAAKTREFGHVAFGSVGAARVQLQEVGRLFKGPQGPGQDVHCASAVYVALAALKQYENLKEHPELVGSLGADCVLCAGFSVRGHADANDEEARQLAEAQTVAGAVPGAGTG